MPLSFTGPSGIAYLTPAPLVVLQKTVVRDNFGNILHPEYVFTMTGTIVNTGSSLDSPGAQNYDISMTDVLNEQERIRNTFQGDGGLLQITSPANGGSISAYCTVESIEFHASTWTIRCDYTIVLRAKKIEGQDTVNSELDSISERWNITENDDRTYSINHELKAVGALIYGSGGMNNPLLAARQWCSDRRVGITTGQSGVLFVVTPAFFNLSTEDVYTLNASQLQALNLLTSSETSSSGINGTGTFWNYSAIESIGQTDREWNLTENFIFCSGSAREIWNAKVSFDSNDVYKANVSINGSVFGYADRASNMGLRSIRAKSYYELSVVPQIYIRLSAYAPSGYTLSPIPISKEVSYELSAGVVNYATNLIAVSGMLISGALDEAIGISDVGCTDVFAQIPVPGRAGGPVVQYMNTCTLPERTVSINATMLPSTQPMSLATLRSMYLSKPNTNAIVDALKPESGLYYIKQDTEEWNPVRRQYGRVVSWTINAVGMSVSGTSISGVPYTVNSI